MVEALGSLTLAALVICHGILLGHTTKYIHQISFGAFGQWEKK